MAFFQRLGRDGNVLAAGIGGTRRLGKMLRRRRPQHVGLTLQDALDVRKQRLVGRNGYLLLKFLHGFDLAVIVLHPPLGVAGGGDQFLENPLLRLDGMRHEFLDARQAPLHEPDNHVVDHFHCF